MGKISLEFYMGKVEDGFQPHNPQTLKAPPKQWNQAYRYLYLCLCVVSYGNMSSHFVPAKFTTSGLGCHWFISFSRNESVWVWSVGLSLWISFFCFHHTWMDWYKNKYNLGPFGCHDNISNSPEFSGKEIFINKALFESWHTVLFIRNHDHTTRINYGVHSLWNKKRYMIMISSVMD